MEIESINTYILPLQYVLINSFHEMSAGYFIPQSLYPNGLPVSRTLDVILQNLGYLRLCIYCKCKDRTNNYEKNPKTDMYQTPYK